MNILAFDTSTEVLAIALGRFQGGTLVDLREQTTAGGAQASAALVPTVLSMLGDAGLELGDLEAIAFGRGPGAFTGLRTACAVAQGLAWGAGLRLLPVDTLLAVAEDARARHGAVRVIAAIDARMGEIYAASYEHGERGWHEVRPAVLTRAEALEVPLGWTLAGNAGALHAPHWPGAVQRVEALPTAGAMVRLAPTLLAQGLDVAPEQALPLYIRDKVAQTTAERAAARPVASVA